MARLGSGSLDTGGGDTGDDAEEMDDAASDTQDTTTTSSSSGGGRSGFERAVEEQREVDQTVEETQTDDTGSGQNGQQQDDGFEQGVEAGGSEVSQQAREFETELANEYGISPENIRIERQDGQLVARVSQAGAQETVQRALNREGTGNFAGAVAGQQQRQGDFLDDETREQREGAERAVRKQQERNQDLDFATFKPLGRPTPGGATVPGSAVVGNPSPGLEQRTPGSTGDLEASNVDRDFDNLDPYEKLSANVDGDAPAPLEFRRTSDGTIQFELFGQGDPPEGTERISAGEAFREQFATPDRDVTASLTAGTEAGFLTDEEEQAYLDKAQELREFYGVGDELKEFTIDLTGNETVANFAGGVGDAPGNILAAVDEGIVLADTGVETAQNVEATSDEFGNEATWDAIGESFGAAAVAIGSEARENPARFTGELVGELAIGSVAFKGVEKAGDASRAARLSTRRTVDLEDITTERGAKGELPKFDTDPDAPTSEAVREVSERAADNPDVVNQGTGGDSTLFHGTQSKFDDAFDVTEGASELPGLFTSPEASPIALQGLAKSADLSSLKPRLPRPSGKSDRFLGLPGDTVKAMDEAATGAGYELQDTATGAQVRGGLGRGEAKALAEGIDEVDVAPDQTTAGYEFLTEQADPGAAYVRPQGARTSELEAIFPPGSQFQKTGTVGVRVGRRTIPGTDRTIPFSGRTVPLDLFERAGDDLADLDDAGGALESLQAGDAATAGRLSSDIERLSAPEGSVAAGGGVTGVSAGLFGSASSGVDAAVSSMTSGVDLFDDSELDDGTADSMASRTDSPRGSDTESTGLESGTGDIDATSDLSGDSTIESVIEPVESTSPTETTPTSSPPPSTPGTPGSKPPSEPTSPPGGPSGTEGPPGSSLPPSSPPGSPTPGTPTSGGPTPIGEPSTPVVPPTSLQPDPSLEQKERKKRKKTRVFAASEKFENPVATPDDILFEGALDLDGVDVELVD